MFVDPTTNVIPFEEAGVSDFTDQHRGYNTDNVELFDKSQQVSRNPLPFLDSSNNDSNSDIDNINEALMTSLDRSSKDVVLGAVMCVLCKLTVKLR